MIEDELVRRLQQCTLELEEAAKAFKQFGEVDGLTLPKPGSSKRFLETAKELYELTTYLTDENGGEK